MPAADMCVLGLQKETKNTVKLSEKSWQNCVTCVKIWKESDGGQRILIYWKAEIQFTNNVKVNILQLKRRIHLTPEQASDFYAEHYGKMFFPSLVAYMSSGAIIVMVLARENAIPYWRELCGPTHSVKARETHPESIRALYGFDDQRNAVHGSDGIISAEREIRFMFNSSIVEPIPMKQAAKDYLERAVNVTLLAGLTELCKQKPEDPVKWLADWLVANNPNKPTISDTYKVEEA